MERTSITTERLVLRAPERTDAVAVPSILDEVVVAAMGRTAEAVGFHRIGTTPHRPLPDGSRVEAACDVREW